LIGDTATTKEVFITGFPLWHSQRLKRHNGYARKFCFDRVSVSVFVRFAFARLGSAPLGSGRLGAREGSSRDYMYKKIWHGHGLKWYLILDAISKACWKYLNVYGQGGGREEGQVSPPFPAITPSPVEV